MDKRCMGCMAFKQNSPVCEHCGYDERSRNSDHQLPAGTEVGGQYILGRVLGQGGFGITYLGWDKIMNTRVAVKEYFPKGYAARTAGHTGVTSFDGQNRHDFEHNMQRFIREADSLARLWNIPQIVRVLRCFEENDTAYIAMEYVEGMDLRNYLRRRGKPLTVQETLALLGPVIQALGYVHEANLVHRDIAPDNIMVQPDGTTKLLDFGAARYVENADAEQDRATSTQAILKDGFAPPEQYRTHGALGPWSDVYAMCATVYYCLTGKVPPEAMARTMDEEPIDWSIVRGLSQKQEAALKKGLALRPANRYASVATLWKDLKPEPVKSALEPTEKKDADLLRKNSTQEHSTVHTNTPKVKKKKKKWLPLAAAAMIAAIVGVAVLSGNSERKALSVPENPVDIFSKIDTANVTCTYEENETGITITGFTGELPEEAVLPGKIDGKKVTAIGSNAFCNYKNLRNVIIPQGVMTVGFKSFADCADLNYVQFPDSMVAIGDYAFSGCKALTEITIPNGVTSIGANAFYSCSNLSTVTLPESVTDIGASAFSCCGNLNNIEIPKMVASIENRTFYDCRMLSSITIPDSVKSIGESAFDGCRDLRQVKISRFCKCFKKAFPNDCEVTYYVEVFAYTYKQNETGITITGYTGELPSKTVILPKEIDGNKVTAIGFKSFYASTGLNSITLPDSITTIGDYAFSGCKALTDIYIPNGVVSIGGNAFYGCSSLNDVTLPESISNIGVSAFSCCRNLESIVIPEGITSIDNNTFFECVELHSVSIPESVKFIGVDAFSGCRQLTGVKISRECKISKDAFPDRCEINYY